MSVAFYLGVHRPSWLAKSPVPLFISRRVLMDRKVMPVAMAPWALDSGGFSELSLYGEWRTTAKDYISDVERYAREIGQLEWVTPQDWMCEPHMLAMTGLPIAEHQRRTVKNFLHLRERLGEFIIPVLQGWTLDDYQRHVEDYATAGVDLEREPRVGVGSVCRRRDARAILRPLGFLRIHAFGIKGDTLAACSDFLTSADSMAWSYRARHSEPLPGCTHKSCANCLRFALRWRGRLIQRLDQGRLFEEVSCNAA